MEHQDKIASCKCHQRSQKSFWKGGKRRGVTHSCCQSSVCHWCCLCNHSGMIYQLLEDIGYKCTVRTSWVKLIEYGDDYNSSFSKITQKVWEPWYINHIAQINCFSYQSLGTSSGCHKCHASFHAEKTSLTLCLWDGEDMKSMLSQETHYIWHVCSSAELLSMCPTCSTANLS